MPLLYYQPQAMSHGLNMQMGGCRDIAWFGLTDSLEVYDQLNARVYRQGWAVRSGIHHLWRATRSTCRSMNAWGKSQSQTDARRPKRYASLKTTSQLPAREVRNGWTV